MINGLVFGFDIWLLVWLYGSWFGYMVTSSVIWLYGYWFGY